jgi:hypothetical protein
VFVLLTVEGVLFKRLGLFLTKVSLRFVISVLNLAIIHSSIKKFYCIFLKSTLNYSSFDMNEVHTGRFFYLYLNGPFLFLKEYTKSQRVLLFYCSSNMIWYTG